MGKKNTKKSNPNLSTVSDLTQIQVFPSLFSVLLIHFANITVPPCSWLILIHLMDMVSYSVLDWELLVHWVVVSLMASLSCSTFLTTVELTWICKIINHSNVSSIKFFCKHVPILLLICDYNPYNMNILTYAEKRIVWYETSNTYSHENESVPIMQFCPPIVLVIQHQGEAHTQLSGFSN